MLKVGALAVGALGLGLSRIWRGKGGAASYRARYWSVVAQRLLSIVLVAVSRLAATLGLKGAAHQLYLASCRRAASCLGLGPARFTLGVRRMDIRIEMADGIVTWATLHSPRTDAEAPADDSAGTPCELPRLPVVLVRTPYSRRNLNSWGTIYAERGYHLVAQDTRGRFSSTGEFFPMLAEARDGEEPLRGSRNNPGVTGTLPSPESRTWVCPLWRPFETGVTLH